MDIHFRSTDHKTRFITAMQHVGKMDDDLIDKEYGTALYLLTADSGLWNSASRYVSSSGIRFHDFLKRDTFSSGEAALVKLAANLFYSQLKQIYVEPVELVWLGENYFTLAINALKLRYYGLRYYGLNHLHKLMQTTEVEE